MSDSREGQLRDEDWTSLVYAIKAGKCTLMLGPHAVTAECNGVRQPVLFGLAEFVKDRLGPEFAHLDTSQPSTVAQVAVAREDEFVLQGWVKEFYAQLDDDFDVLRDLASLPLQLVLNTSPGLSADHVFREVKPGTRSDFYDRTSPRSGRLPDLSVDAPIIYNLYGSLDRLESLILTDNDRLDFLVAVISETPPLPPKLTAALKDPQRSFLFLGFDLAQWQLRILLHVLARNADRKYKSFAAEIDAAKVDDGTRAFYRSDHRLSFFSMELPTFVAELCRRVEEGAETGDHRPAGALEPDAPVVFLCHASEDKLVASAVAAGLRRNGIATWLDKEELRGGDRWGPMIERTIKEDVNYVVVLQSEHLLAKDVGYVNKEISLALERQRHYRAPRRFLIPAIIDSVDNQLDDLDGIQFTDLSTDTGVDDLVKTIRRDLARAGS